ncbi:MAG: DinB family protein [Kordiimonadaceae bacterium]|nr:DinB family protein [Kordiimonadaceae bacterium]
MSLLDTCQMLMRFKRWSNAITYKTVAALPESESLKIRQTRFGSMVNTLNHVYVVDDIFRAHLLGQTHSYTARNTDTHPPVTVLWAKVQKMDDWYVAYTESLTDAALAEGVTFEFVGGGDGAMTRNEILQHIVNHGNYHRGFVGDMLYQANVTPPATDLPVFLRDGKA